MTWLAPWALLGLLAVAVPIVIHLITRRRTRVRRFPTLRFIAPSAVLPVRALRPSDPLLLAIRSAIIAAAAVALAQPVLLSEDRVRHAADVLVRAIVVDTSASMRRATTRGGSALDAARELAATLAAEATIARSVETAVPAGQLAGAGEWLEDRPGRREIVVVSDFQLHTLAQADLADVPDDIGLAFAKVPVADDGGVDERVVHGGGFETVVRTAFVGDTTDASWSVRAAAETPLPISLLGSKEEGGVAGATIEAASAFVTAAADPTHAVAIVLPSYEGRAQLERTARPPDAPWMADVVAGLPPDIPIDQIARGAVDGGERLLLFADVAAGSLASAALVVAAANALTGEVPAAEREPETIDDAQLRAWERRPARSMTGVEGGAADGRWLWLVALVLLGVEMLVRRPRAAARAPGQAEGSGHAA